MAEKYAEDKFRKSGGKSFVIELNEEVDKAVDKALALVERNKLKKAEKHLAELLSEYPNYHMVQYGMNSSNSALNLWKGASGKKPFMPLVNPNGS
jgi:hypothetical protein